MAVTKQPKQRASAQQQIKSEVNPMAVKVNFKAVTTDFPVREKGEYDVTYIGHTINPASATSGQPTVRLTWSEDSSPNKKIMKTYSLQETALWSLKRDMIRMGADIEEMNNEDAILDDILDSLIGAKNTVMMGEPRPYTRKNKITGEEENALGDNFQEIKDPSKL